ncbi:MAG: YIP1 family protein [Planctomycetota bacterium]|nr:MAG: YIP1 family protein [Planctomycetota bacterium]REJ87871.1 MAG: YIP1 family protein [Planctomycetota bacterium]REK26448.1 MAG: YIP1 family protein [Planctomycetota bacterium]REK38715.1 MAG: YIP1 family protein [Planctomycetota bacterium]
MSVEPDSPADWPAQSQPDARPLSLFSLWLTIGPEPRETMRRILDVNPTYQVVPLAMMYGITRALIVAARRNLADTMTPLELFGWIVVAGPLVAVVGIYGFSHVIRFYARWFGGQATPRQVRAAMVWGSSPTIWTLPIWLLQITLFGEMIFAAERPPEVLGGGWGAFYSGCEYGKAMLNIGAIYVALKCLGEAFGFSAWRALFAVLLALVTLLLLMIPILAVLPLA